MAKKGAVVSTQQPAASAKKAGAAAGAAAAEPSPQRKHKARGEIDDLFASKKQKIQGNAADPAAGGNEQTASGGGGGSGGEIDALFGQLKQRKPQGHPAVEGDGAAVGEAKKVTSALLLLPSKAGLLHLLTLSDSCALLVRSRHLPPNRPASSSGRSGGWRAARTTSLEARQQQTASECHGCSLGMRPRHGASRGSVPRRHST